MMSIILAITLISTTINFVKTDTIKFLGDTDSQFCKNTGYEIPASVDNYNPCYIYCDGSGKIYKTLRSFLSICGKRSVCIHEYCLLKESRLLQICQKLGYNYGVKNPEKICEITCYKNDGTMKNVYSPEGDFCTTRLDNGVHGTCSADGRCKETKEPLT